jgi:hypothetical protein
MWGALSDERTGLSFTMYNIFTFYMLLHECIYNIYKASVSPGSVTELTDCQKEIDLLTVSRHGPHRKHCSSFAVYGLFYCNGRCLVVCFAVVA